MKPKLVVCGAAGRMGKRIIALAIEDSQFNIIGAVERKEYAQIGEDAGAVAAASHINIKLDSTYPAGADVVIDFSLPEAADNTINYCLKSTVALVMGTTGLSEKQQNKIEIASEKIPIIYCANMSVGMNVLFSLVGKVASMLGDEYDIEIIEQHHRFKKDAPSGSALTLAENICKVSARDYPDCITHGRSGKDVLRANGSIGIHAIRAGDITGKHEVIFGTPGETISLGHTAHSRDTFARGALRAAKWLIGKNPGLYSMADVLGIKK